MDEANYCCPHCGENGSISEVSLAWIGYRGQFSGTGHIDMFDTETPVIRENQDDPLTYYVCHDCDKEFTDPVTIKEYAEEHKKD